MADGTGTQTPHSVTARITGKSEDIPRLVEAFADLRKKGGDCWYILLRPVDGRLCLAQIHRGTDNATVWTESSAGDFLPQPATRRDWSEAQVAAMRKSLMDSMGREEGPSVLRGDWNAELEMADRPILVLWKAVSTYAILEIRSTARGWEVRVARKATWFQKEGLEQMNATFGRLSEAIPQGIAWVTTGAVASACSMRDTHIRARVDTDYAALKPPKPPAPPPKSPAPAKFGTGIDLPKPPPAPKAPKPPKAQAAPAAPAAPAPKAPRGRKATVPTLAEIPAPPVPSCPVSTANIAASVQKEAESVKAETGSLWGDNTPELLKRAGNLIRRAQSLVASPLCTGTEKQQAEAELRKAMAGFEKARAELGSSDAQSKTAVRRIAEQVALAAAKAGRSCAGGRQKPAPKAQKRDEVWMDVPARQPTATPQAQPAAPAARAAAPAAKGRKKAPEAVDAAKDAVLMSAVTDAIRGVMAELTKEA